MCKKIDDFEIKTMSKAQLAEAYGISKDTLRAWINRLKSPALKQLGETKKLLTPAQVACLVEIWGAP